MYKKAGVLLSGIVSDHEIQLSIERPVYPSECHMHLMKMIDTINARWGRDTLRYAAAGTNQPWKMKQMAKSPCYTTNWHELLSISI